MYKVLASDGLEKSAIDNLVSFGFYVENNHYSDDVLIKRIKDFDVLIVRSATKVRKNILDEAIKGNLKLIIRAGVGTDNIDVDYACSKGVSVGNTPNSSSNAVAELVLGHMFALTRFIGISNYTMRNGQWNKKKYKGVELNDKTLGIIGMGRIGRSLAKKAEVLGMKVQYYTIEGKHKDLNYDFLSLEEVLKTSDFISLHVPYEKEKGALIGKRELNIIKDGAYIINCARGKVIDEEALLESLNSGKIAGAGIDVFEEEPTKNKDLVSHQNVSCTPHIGAATKEAQERIGEEVVSIIKDFFKIDD
ncbi:D-2-hydroxyacid dehydrogenase [Clostridium septicum]|uniref:D-2-hydroxyacid dehydrogenase n=1 Tax=Clostridium septicum TaxID=1504 RepID=UPI000830E125|nr:D-2-hydroxyacid dehydrogenase [Clostridium septicum]